MTDNHNISPQGTGSFIDNDVYKFLPILFISMASIMFALFNVSDTIAIFGIAVFVIFTMLSLIYTKIDRLVEKRFPDSYMMSKEKEYDTKYKRANMEDKERLKLTTEAISRIRFDLSRKLELFIISIVSSIISIILFLIFVDTLSLSLEE